MTDTYDALIDHLEELAVAAVQQPTPAVCAYWLMQASQAGHPHRPLEREPLEAQAPDWARPYVSQALQDVLRQGPWCEPAGFLASGQRPRTDDLAVAPLTPLTWPWRPAYRPYLDEVHVYTGRIWEAACRLYSPPGQAAPPTEVLRGALLFDAGLYFACHEYFETLWGRSADEASDFYQGLIQIAVAMRHLQSHNVRGAIILLRYGMGRLQRYPAVYKALPVVAVLQQLAQLLTHLESLTEPTAYQFEAQQVPRLLRP